MSNQRRQKPRNNNNNYYHNHHQRNSTITQSSKPPLANYTRSVPAWEKKFCEVVGLVPWWKVVEAKRFMCPNDRVIQWDDSAGEDAFKNAKSRFWAEMNGFPCDLALPDPYAYIDDVDSDAEVDNELILDLYRGPEPKTEGEEEKECVVILDALFLTGEYSGPGWGPGWGDDEEIVGTVKPKNSWEDQKWDGYKEIVGNGEPKKSWEDQKCVGWNEDSWGRKETTGTWDHKNLGWGDAEEINEEIVGMVKPKNSWEDQKWDGYKDILGNGKPKNSWDDQKCVGWNEDSWGRKETTGTWDHKNNNNSFKTKSWDRKNSNNNNSFNHKKVENWNCKDQGRENREWRKKGEVPRGGDRVEDWGWKNGRGRSRGGFQQHSNGWDWTESF